MKLSPPKTITWVIAVILGLLGIFATMTRIQFVTPNAIWFVFAGFALLAISTLVKGL